MADGEILIDTKINTKGIDQDLKNLKNKIEGTTEQAEEMGDTLENAADQAGEALEDATDKAEEMADALEDTAKTADDAGKSAGSLSDQLKEVFKKGGTVATVMGTVVKATQKAAEIIRETSDAYKVQINAERGLALAAEKNPYINAEGVESLKAFASELQKTSNIGDEMSLQLITRLTAAGRTQEQIEKIMKAAANAAASGAIEFESAVENLNNTLNGEAGEIADLVPAIHNLTTEQLENGEAIDLINQQYEGMSAALADAATQAQNAKGDFAEAIGELTAPTANAWDNFWKGFYEKGSAFIKKINNKLDLLNFSNKDFIKETTKLGQLYSSKTNTTGLDIQTDEYLERGKELLELKQSTKKLTDEEKDALFQINVILNKRAEQEKYAREEEEKQLKAQKEQLEQIEAQKRAEEERANARKQRDLDAAALKDQSEDSLNKQIARIRKEAELRGEAADEQAIYNAILANYLNLIIDSNGLITENNTLADTRRKQLAEQSELLKTQAEAEKAAADAAKEKAQAEADAAKLKEKAQAVTLDKTPIEQLRDENAELEKLRDEINSNQILSEENLAAELETIDLKILENQKKIDEQMLAEKRAALEKNAAAISNYSKEWFNVLKDVGGLMAEYNKAQNESELADLEKKYKAGEIGEEKYAEEKKRIRQKAARDEYAANIVSWTASLLTATANIAQGVTKAIAQGGVAGIATGALVSAAGALQLAAIIGSKPKPPAFAAGGVVPGASYTGDLVSAQVNSGEMVLTQEQQRALFDMANGRGGGNASPNIIINNNASDMVTARPKVTREEIQILIDAQVNDSLKNGKYTESLTMAEQGRTGEFLGI